MRLRRDDQGVYAILYAVLVVVLLGMGAIVVDLAEVRKDRRLDRSAADSAAVAGAAFLSPASVGGGSSPYAACRGAWAYIAHTLRISTPAGACSAFAGFTTSAAVQAYCSTPSPAEIGDDRTIGDRTIRIAWPIPYHVGGVQSGFLTPEIAPGSASQTFDADVDGTPEGCDRLGVAVFETEKFGLGGGVGVGGTYTQVHSVARFAVEPGGTPAVAALNVMNTHACKALSTGGQGVIIVNRSIDSRDPSHLGQGIIAVESSGADCGAAASDWVMDVSSNNNNRVCASGPDQVPDLVGTCDGEGLILLHSLDPGGRRAYPGSPGAPTVPIDPRPVSENGIAQWMPVTDVYGCHALPTLSNPPVSCGALTPNYIDDLYDLYAGGTSAPTQVYSGVGAYTGASYGAFRTLPGPDVPAFTCSPSNLYIPPGNWFINCPDSNAKAGFSLLGAGSVVVFGGGHVVFQGGIDAAKNGACFAFNVPLASNPAPGSVTCPVPVNAQSNVATTSPAPTQEAILLSRGTKPISNGSSNVTMLLPQTLIVQSRTGTLDLGGGTGTVLWTAPGAGTRIGIDSRLDSLCNLVKECLDSHFQKISYWSESTLENSIGGQGSVTYVGVFFAPRAPFVFKGQGGGAGTNAQFWADTLTLDGQAKLFLTPDNALAIPRPVFRVSLIR